LFFNIPSISPRDVETTIWELKIIIVLVPLVGPIQEYHTPLSHTMRGDVTAIIWGVKNTTPYVKF